MSVYQKKLAIIKHFRENGGLPKGTLHIQPDTADVGNVYIDGVYYGTFDYAGKQFIEKW